LNKLKKKLKEFELTVKPIPTVAEKEPIDFILKFYF